VIDAHRSATNDDIVWFGVSPTRVDLLRRIPGVDFEEAYSRRMDVVWDGVPVTLIGRDDLIANKRASGRPQDRRDVRELERTKRPR
jgi:hypothetical protein